MLSEVTAQNIDFLLIYSEIESWHARQSHSLLIVVS